MNYLWVELKAESYAVIAQELFHLLIFSLILWNFQSKANA